MFLHRLHKTASHPMEARERPRLQDVHALVTVCVPFVINRDGRQVVVTRAAGRVKASIGRAWLGAAAAAVVSHSPSAG